MQIYKTFSIWLFISTNLCLLVSCSVHTDPKVEEKDFSIDISSIPKDTISFDNPKTTYVNGMYFFEGKEYSGVVIKVLKGFNIKTYNSVLDGKLHGIYKSFYENGEPKEVRQYKNNLAIGKHYGFWKSTGNLKFEYHYNDQRKEGTQKNWYANGNPSYEYNYVNDREVGFQKAWRRNGSLYRNFEVINGRRYGLQKSVQCYELEKEEIM